MISSPTSFSNILALQYLIQACDWLYHSYHLLATLVMCHFLKKIIGQFLPTYSVSTSFYDRNYFGQKPEEFGTFGVTVRQNSSGSEDPFRSKCPKVSVFDGRNRNFVRKVQLRLLHWGLFE